MLTWKNWLDNALTQVQVLPRQPRVPFLLNGEVIGSVEPGFLIPFAHLGKRGEYSLLQNREHSAWELNGDASVGLAALALALRKAGLTGAWRNELLRVNNVHGSQVGVVERAAVRSLGIATQAVHLVGFTEDDRVWVQQRALSKATDPGLWDTLMGGMVSATDSLAQALARESWEEAGLQLEQMQGLVHRGHIDFTGPSRDAHGAGYLVERIDWYTCTLPREVVPVNQDGEVAQFACLSRQEMLGLLAQGMFTLEAGLILAAATGLHNA
ncbi:MAG: NUDIX domain-containing protein [Hylemonella sp.]|nr:NUDIX domain-containing protein [Hylemonella sp.]